MKKGTSKKYYAKVIQSDMRLRARKPYIRFFSTEKQMRDFDPKIPKGVRQQTIEKGHVSELKSGLRRNMSEKRLMKLKRSLKKRAKKLRLGKKRTGAYVYGTLRRVRGNPITKPLTDDQRRRVSDAIRECSNYIKKESARRADIRPPEAQKHLDFCIAHRERLYRLAGRDIALEVAQMRKMRKNPGSRYRVGGSSRTYTLEEAKRVADHIFKTRGVIVSIEEHRPTPQVAPSWKTGIYTGKGIAKNPAKTKASPIPGKFYRVYWSHPSRGETAPLIFKGEKLRELNISQLSSYWPLREGLKMAKVHFRGPYDSWDNAFMDS